ncbi:MAG TPA: hypothetical protein VMB03_24875 [Bryobacteraceae bacterium]|nr:hypothetical protein [Bryobacteraceae bacterium]
MATLLMASAARLPASQLTPSAARAFDTYVSGVEARLALPPASAAPPTSLAIDPVNGGTWPVPGGRLHHWRAAAVVPGATPAALLDLLRDNRRLARYYSPEVVSSRTLFDQGDRTAVAMRFVKRQIVTVVLDAEFETLSGLLDSGTRGFCFSRSTHIWQVDRAGTGQEHRRAQGDDDGLLWKLNSYWTFQQAPEGLRISCEAVSLTRDVPAGLGWLVVPIIRTLPRDSLEFMLSATTKALLARRSGDDRDN